MGKESEFEIREEGRNDGDCEESAALGVQDAGPAVVGDSGGRHNGRRW